MRAQRARVILWMIVCLTPGSGWARKLHGPSCSSCHDQGEKLRQSAHASVGCTTCHVRHEQYPHPAGIPKPTCDECHAKIAGEHARSVHGQALRKGNAAAPDCGVCHGNVHELARASSAAFHKAVPDTCGMCHTEITEQFRASVHGRAVTRGITAAPVCTTSHGEHSILSPKNAGSPVNPTHIRETCGQCHGSVALSRRFGLSSDRLVSFDASFHGMAARSGSQTVANCASCHGIHNIFAPSDPQSTINPKNLPATCGKCHPGAGTRFALGTIHELQGRAEPRSVRWARQFYMLVIPLTLGLMFLHHLGDWVRKLIRLRFTPAAEPADFWRSRYQRSKFGAVRMYGIERIEHALLLVSFAC